MYSVKPCPVCNSTNIDACSNQIICRACLFVTSPEYWDRLPRWIDILKSSLPVRKRKGREKESLSL